MWTRCTRISGKSWADYGGRGITVCERWRSFPNFLADMGERPLGTTLEREENDGNYDPSNCCWATKTAQARNSRKNRRVQFEGRSATLSEVAERLGANYDTLRSRLNRGWPLDRVLTGPFS